MVCDNTKDRSPLLPDRHPTPDFFVCDIFDAVPKADMASMEHPIFSLSTKPDRRIRKYENGGQFIEIRPSADGLATVHDRDILIFCISQVMAMLNQDKPVGRVLRFKARDLLTATNRGTDGRGYEQLKAAFERLGGTRITTNIITGTHEITRGFGLIDSFEIVRETRDGRMIDVEITLSDWVFNAIRAKEVLTIHRDYFRLRKPLERRLYEIGRKHCGKSAVWRIGLDKLKLRCGSNSTDKEFKRLVSKIVTDDEASGHIPDYSLSLEPSVQHNRPDNLVFTNRGKLAEQAKRRFEASLLTGSFPYNIYQTAKSRAPTFDVYALESEWREWIAATDQEPPRNPGKAFIGFCERKYRERNTS